MRIPSTFRDRRPIELQLTPMIDCVFLLMIYFLWSSSFAVAELSLPTKLSAAPREGIGFNTKQPPPPESDYPSVIVRILSTGDKAIWMLNETPVASLAELRQQLMAVARIKRDAPIVIDPASDVSLGDVIDVFDVSRLIGFEKIQFAADASALGVGDRE